MGDVDFTPFCSGRMPGISSARHPSFPIRVREREECGERSGAAFPSLPFLDGPASGGRNTGDTVSRLENRPTFQSGRVGVPAQQKRLFEILTAQTRLPADFPEWSVGRPCVVTYFAKEHRFEVKQCRISCCRFQTK